MIMKQFSNQKLCAAKAGKNMASYLLAKEEGFTIIESLVAIVVLSILLAAIAPVFALSVATRVQARRVELASQAARSYIDGVRSQKILPPATPATSTALTAVDAPIPTGSFTCTANSYCTASSTSTTATNLYCIDFDGSGSCEITSVTDMVLQVFRYHPSSNVANQGYALGVRAYRADAFKETTTLLKSSSLPNNKQATFTGGMGQRKAPLVEMTADINDIVPKYTDLCARFPGGCN
ncbi:hormogonium polysaccharide secretion pseudopilin HpsB [Chlorogloeopsis sp. ULAP02]|uniref:hormogonium polysaccharide secretion pseudopilin HpsB n=1 Tax=Chlorogloeopsis sp. ULAP02 TaxID=3107926 RepID=UPI0031357E58